MKFVLLKELKITGEARVLFSPNQLAVIIKKYPQHNFAVESSNTRCFNDKEYTDLGINVVKNITDADILMGIKEIPINALIPGKKYFFFSHTTKMQTHNKTYLQGLLNAGITFYDYENFTDNTGKRLVSFGKNAGFIGAYQSIKAYGLKNKLFTLPSPTKLSSFAELNKQVQNSNLPVIKIVVTGNGNVGSGIQKFLKLIGIQQINPDDFLNKNYTKPVFTQLSKKHYLTHKKTESYSESDFKSQPTDYKSTFLKFAQQAELLITGHYHHTGMPLFFTKEDIKDPQFKINTIGDISCDLHTPLPTCLRASTPSNPIYGYHKFCGSEYKYSNKDSIAVMAIDNLPCEMPRETSVDFGKQFMEQILPTLMSNFDHPILTNACVIKKGSFTDKYRYLKKFITAKNTIECI